MRAPFLIYVHGYLAPPSIMGLLRRRLADVGLKGAVFGYVSTRGSMREHAGALADFVVRQSGGERDIWIVGHSIGGILARLATGLLPDGTVAGLVQIATPIRGCSAARGIALRPALRHLIGGIPGELSHFPAGFEGDLGPLGVSTGVIAGGTGGTGGFSSLLAGDNDGLIRVCETYPDEDVYEHALISVRHNLLPFSRRTAKLVAHFISTHTFKGAAREGTEGLLHLQRFGAEPRAKQCTA